MSLVYPLGLLALLGIAYLIALYLLRPKYEERAVSSVYLWKLSERFRRKHAPLQRAKSALLFLLQALMILCAALLIMQPLVRFAGSGVETIAILDGSASMSITDAQGLSRFERAKSALLADAKALRFGSTMTAILAGTQAEVLAEQTTLYSELEYAVRRASCGFGGEDLDGALAEAREIAFLNPNARVILYTDKQYAEAVGIEVVNVVSGGEWNAAALSLTAHTEGAGLVFDGTVACYGRDAELTCALYVNGRLVSASTAFCPSGEETALRWDMRSLSSFTKAELRVSAADGFTADNSFTLTRPPANAVNVLLVSETPFFMQSVLSVFPAVHLTVANSIDDAQTQGQDLYIFDQLLPENAPGDGMSLYINPVSAPPGTDVRLGAQLRGTWLTLARESGDAVYDALSANLSGQDIGLMQFRETLDRGSLTPILLCGEMPVLMAGETRSGVRCAIFTFDLHDTNLPLLDDFVVLAHNLLEYAMPSMLDEQTVDCGTELIARTIPRCTQVYLQRPDGTSAALPPESDGIRLSLREPGVYTLLQERPDDASKFCDFFVRVPAQESDTALRTELTRLALSAYDSETSVESRSDYNPLAFIALLLFALLTVECVVFNREQY